MSNYKFKVGDEVVIVNIAYNYPYFEDMIRYLGLSVDLFVKGERANEGDVGVIIAMDKHCIHEDDGVVYAVLLPKEGRVILIAEAGVELKNQKKPKVKKVKKEPPPPVTKTIFHYTDGSSYVRKHMVVGSLNWEDKVIHGYDTNSFSIERVSISDDLLAVEIRHLNGAVGISVNPKYKSSVKVDVKTIRQRCKEGNK